MSRLTLRLPQTLHRQLKEEAHLEGISLNQYIVYGVSSQKIGVNSRQTRQVLETCWVFPRIIEYVPYELTRQVTSAYTAYAHSEEEVVEREAQFTALRESLKKGSPEEIEEALAKREVVEPEPGLTPEMLHSLRERIEAVKQATAS